MIAPLRSTVAASAAAAFLRLVTTGSQAATVAPTDLLLPLFPDPGQGARSRPARR
ncbi:hypothetical protein ACIBAH_16995 [Streptomyces sp. NPDC051445]|uniref:hypothetical protein n=1 Tax=Streptomyces sp. NPDC051445 TaxID=3365653 RepID=UPI0037B4313D